MDLKSPYIQDLVWSFLYVRLSVFRLVYNAVYLYVVFLAHVKTLLVM